MKAIVTVFGILILVAALVVPALAIRGDWARWMRPPGSWGHYGGRQRNAGEVRRVHTETRRGFGLEGGKLVPVAECNRMSGRGHGRHVRGYDVCGGYGAGNSWD